MQNPYFELHRKFRQAGAEVVIALAVEHDRQIQADEERVHTLQAQAGDFPRRFTEVRARWRRESTALPQQHEQLKDLARCLLPRK